MNNLTYYLTPDCPDDVRKLQEAIGELQLLAPSQVEILYRAFSDDCYSASWMIPDPDTIIHFAVWLREER